MFKKTRVRQIIEPLQKNLSDREISNVLGVSRNTVSRIRICEWSYHHKAGPNFQIWFDKGQYSVPSNYLNKYVDVRYNNVMVYIYVSHKRIAEHKRLPSGIKNGKRT